MRLNINKFKTTNMKEKLSVETTQWTEDYVTRENEIKAIDEYKFYPCEPIVVLNVDIYMKDDYNGKVEIDLSNGHKVVYRCDEIRGNCGPQSEMSVSVEREGQTGYQICGEEFGGEYMGSGSWVIDIMKCYENYHKNN